MLVFNSDSNLSPVANQTTLANSYEMIAQTRVMLTSSKIKKGDKHL